MLLGERPYWTAKEDELLVMLWHEGFSVNDIAAQIPGRSRNAITGRRLRLGLPGRASPIPNPLTAEKRSQIEAGLRSAREQIAMAA